jgi:hypothetical protein
MTAEGDYSQLLLLLLHVLLTMHGQSLNSSVQHTDCILQLRSSGSWRHHGLQLLVNHGFLLGDLPLLQCITTRKRGGGEKKKEKCHVHILSFK